MLSTLFVLEIYVKVRTAGPSPTGFDGGTGGPQVAQSTGRPLQGKRSRQIEINMRFSSIDVSSSVYVLTQYGGAKLYCYYNNQSIVVCIHTHTHTHISLISSQSTLEATTANETDINQQFFDGWSTAKRRSHREHPAARSSAFVCQG